MIRYPQTLANRIEYPEGALKLKTLPGSSKFILAIEIARVVLKINQLFFLASFVICKKGKANSNIQKSNHIVTIYA